MPSTYSSRFFNIHPELKVHALIWNEEAMHKTPPCVFLHGFSMNGHCWDKLAEKLSATRCVIAIDFRGHGDSDWDVEQQYNHPTLLSDFINVVEQLQLKRFDLVGHSLGARIAILYTEKNLEKVSTLTIVDVGPEVAESTIKKIRLDAHSTPETFDSKEAYKKYIENMYFLSPDEGIAVIATHGLKRNNKDQLIVKTDPAFITALWSEPSLPTADPKLVLPFADNLWTYFPKITIPVLVVRGSISAVLNRKMAQEMVNAALPNATLKQVSAAGHTVMLDNIDGFNEVMIEFLNEKSS